MGFQLEDLIQVSLSQVKSANETGDFGRVVIRPSPNVVSSRVPEPAVCNVKLNVVALSLHFDLVFFNDDRGLVGRRRWSRTMLNGKDFMAWVEKSVGFNNLGVERGLGIKPNLFPVAYYVV